MKPASSQLIALINAARAGEPIGECDLYAITLLSGLVLYYTNGDVDVLWNGATYSSKGPRFDESQVKAVGNWKVGLDVDTWTVTFAPQATDLIGDTPWLQGVLAGFFDGATVEVDRAFYYLPPTITGGALTPVGTVTIFAGEVAEIDFGRTGITFNINDWRARLTNMMPRNVYSANCRYQLFDSGCTLNADTFAVQTQVTQLDTAPRAFYTAATAFADQYFQLGAATWSSGANKGLRQMIKSSGGGGLGVIELQVQMPFTVAVGDQLTLLPGCNKSYTDPNGCPKFNNLANFGGFPFVPVPETAT